MAKEIFFFGTKSDIQPGLADLESHQSVKYVRCGAHDSPKFLICNSFLEYKELGINKSGNHQSESFLVVDESTPIITREVPQIGGGNKYFIDQQINKDSIVFWPGGLYDKEFLICGHVATIWDTPQSIELYKQFTRKVTKGFKKIGRYYVGHEAIELSRNVRLITMNIKQPVEYDFKI